MNTLTRLNLTGPRGNTLHLSLSVVESARGFAFPPCRGAAGTQFSARLSSDHPVRFVIASVTVKLTGVSHTIPLFFYVFPFTCPSGHTRPPTEGGFIQSCPSAEEERGWRMKDWPPSSPFFWQPWLLLRGTPRMLLLLRRPLASDSASHSVMLLWNRHLLSP